VSVKKKKYFRNNGTGVSVAQESYVLKWYDAKRDAINYDGPFSNEKDANNVLRSYLKSGICCWIVYYDG
tara:strand:- start:338 stop:544 length:207 start_codon:yes stop_codon:yes gene_type:complete